MASKKVHRYPGVLMALVLSLALVPAFAFGEASLQSGDASQEATTEEQTTTDSAPEPETEAATTAEQTADVSAQSDEQASTDQATSVAASASDDESGLDAQALTNSFKIETTGGTAWGDVGAGASDTRDFSDTVEYKISASFSQQNTSKTRSITITVPEGMNIVSVSAPSSATMPADITRTSVTDQVAGQISSVDVSLDTIDLSAYANAPVNNVPAGTWYYKSGTITYNFNETADSVVLYVKVKPSEELYNGEAGEAMRSEASAGSTASVGSNEDLKLSAKLVSGTENLSLEKTESLTQTIATSKMRFISTLSDSLSDSGGDLYGKVGNVTGYASGLGFISQLTNSTSNAQGHLADEYVITCPYPVGTTYDSDKGTYPDGVTPQITVTGDVTTGGVVTYTFKNVYFDQTDNEIVVSPQFKVSADYYVTGGQTSSVASTTNKRDKATFGGVSGYVKMRGSDSYIYSAAAGDPAWSCVIIDEDSIVATGSNSGVGNYNAAGDFTGTDWLGYLGYIQKGASEMKDVPYSVSFGSGLGVKAMQVPVPAGESLKDITITTNKRTLTVASIASTNGTYGAGVNQGNSLGLASDEYISKIEGTISSVSAGYGTSSGSTNGAGYFSGVIVDAGGDLTATENVAGSEKKVTTTAKDSSLNMSTASGEIKNSSGDDANVFYPGGTIKVSSKFATFGWSKFNSSTVVDPDFYILVPADMTLDTGSVKLTATQDDLAIDETDVTSAGTLSAPYSVTIGGSDYQVYKFTCSDLVVQAGTMNSSKSFKGASMHLSYDLHVSYAHAGGVQYNLSDLVFMDTHCAVSSAYSPNYIVNDPGVGSGATNKLVTCSGSFTVQPLPELRVTTGIRALGDTGPFYTYDDSLPTETTASVNAGHPAEIKVNWSNSAPSDFAQFEMYMAVPEEGTAQNYFNNKVTTDVYNQPAQIASPQWTGALTGAITAPGFTVYYSTTGSQQTVDNHGDDNTWQPVSGATWKEASQVTDWSAVKYVKFVYTDNGGVVKQNTSGDFTFPMDIDTATCENGDTDYFRIYFGQGVLSTDVKDFRYSSVLAADVTLGHVTATDTVSKTGGDAFTTDQIKTLCHTVAKDHTDATVDVSQVTVDTDTLNALNEAKQSGKIGVWPLTFTYTDPYIGKAVTTTVNVQLTDNGTDGATSDSTVPQENYGSNNKVFTTGGNTYDSDSIRSAVDLKAYDKDGKDISSSFTPDPDQLDELNHAIENHLTGDFPITFTDEDGNTVTSTITLTGDVDLAVTLTADKTQVSAGDTVTYTVNVINTGSIASEAGQVTFEIPEGMEVSDLDGGTLSADGKTIVYSFDPLTWNGATQFHPVLKVKDGVAEGTIITTRCYISSLGGNELDAADRIYSEDVSVTVVAPGTTDGGTPTDTTGTTGTTDATGSVTPKTGDATSPITLLAIAGLGVAAIFAARRLQRR